MTDEASTGSSRQDRLNQIIAEYLDAIRAAQSPDRQALLDRESDLAAELKAFFADHDKMKELAEPVAESPAPDAGVEQPTLPPRQATLGDEAAEAHTLPPSGAERPDAATLPPMEERGTPHDSAPPPGTTRLGDLLASGPCHGPVHVWRAPSWQEIEGLEATSVRQPESEEES